MGARLSSNADGRGQQGGESRVRDEDKLACITEGSLQEFRDCFNLFDQDNSGCIDAAELKMALTRFGRETTDAEVREMLDLADADGSGKLSFWEFATLMAYQMGEGASPDKTLRAAFKMFDNDENGTISGDEIVDVLRQMGEPITDADIGKVLDDMDENGDGVIDYDEFAIAVTKEMRESGFRLS